MKEDGRVEGKETKEEQEIKEQEEDEREEERQKKQKEREKEKEEEKNDRIEIFDDDKVCKLNSKNSCESLTTTANLMLRGYEYMIYNEMFITK